MKKLLLPLLALLLGSSSMAQTVKFQELEDQILLHYLEGQYQEMLELAPRLLEEEPWRGEGHYYAAVASIELKEYQKAREYLSLAEKQADADLREDIGSLRESIPHRENQDQLMVSAEKMLAEGNKAEAAARFQEAWERYKYNGEAAQMAVDLYLELRKYDEALLILEDEVFEGDPATEEYLARINDIPQVKQDKAFREALVESSWDLAFGYHSDALGSVDRALAIRPKDPEALELKKEILDHMAWEEAENINTVASYRNYLGRKDNRLHREEAEAQLETARQALRSSRPNKAYLSYVYDTIAPIGVSFGSINTRSVGVYISANVNNQLLEGGVETSVEPGEEIPAYGDVVLGLTKKIAHPLWIYAGGGAAYEEFYETELSEVAAMADAGLILNLAGFVFRGGVKTDLEEYRFSAGLGFSF